MASAIIALAVARTSIPLARGDVARRFDRWVAVLRDRTLLALAPSEGGARRRMALRVCSDSLEDRLCDLALICALRKLARFGRVRQIARLDEDGRNIRRLQYDEARLLDAIAMQLRECVQLRQHRAADLDARG